jgi:hypothetical protein
MYITEIRVKGQGMFPMDMLRYDHCHPRTTDDAISLVEDYPREIELIKRTHGKTGAKASIDRWRSFGWEVMTQRVSRTVWD